MQLLPIIIVVSLLAFFIALTLVIFLWRAFTKAERRKRRREARVVGGPVRHLTLRNGKVIPLPHQLYGLGKDELHSADLSTLRTGESEKYREKPRRNPFALTPLEKKPKLFGPRDSSPPSDLEAQTSVDPNKFEENLKTLQILNKRLLEDPQNQVIPRRAESKRKWPGHNQNAVSSKRITESLQKAYNVPSFPNRQLSQTSEVPLSPKSKPLPRHLRRPDRISGLVDPAHRRASKARSDSIQRRIDSISQQLDELPRTRGRQDSGKSFSLPADFPYAEVQSAPSVKVPPPVAAVDTRSSKVRVDSCDTQNPTVTFSTHTTRTKNSRTTSAAHSGTTSKRASTVPSIPPLRLPTAIKVPPPTPATTTSTPEVPKPEEPAQPADIPKPLKTSPSKIRFGPDPKPEARHPRPPNIDVAIANAPHKTSSPLLASARESPEAEPRRGQSARSTRSFATFASSDLSSAWTFGSAQRMPIFPSVAPKAVGVDGTGGNHIAPLRPRSKYGRKVKATGMKALPVLPKSPLGMHGRDAV
ncbi:MAG: hypothetical protein LQ348_005790 [Seirophora lacunosa]|nr:MAG: hypothetical protein LQ344_007764 [Seirophora lacunosa]KAI4177598.1 MAG: hypothetical protein LQ348_005790 [Seirophora lacunosa]